MAQVIIIIISFSLVGQSLIINPLAQQISCFILTLPDCQTCLTDFIKGYRIKDNNKDVTV